MRGKKSRLSRLEWEVMSVIWDLGGNPSVRDVMNKAYGKGEKAYTTIQTVMNNLERKGYLKKHKIGLVNFYKPVEKRRDSVKKETSDFVEKVFGGSFLEMAHYLINSGSLSKEEISDLKSLIKENDKKG